MANNQTVFGNTAYQNNNDTTQATQACCPKTGPTALTELPEKFLRDLWGTGGEQDGMLGICSRSTGFSSTWFEISEDGIKAAAAKAIELGEDVYFHCASHDISKTSARGNNDSASMVPGSWVDIDVAEADKGNGKNYPPLELALKFLRDLTAPPSCIVNSGNGLHAYWFYEQPVPAQEHRRLAEAFQAYLRSVFVNKETGESYDIDSTGDLARLMRMLGTHNSKGGRIVSIVDPYEGRRYSVDELARLCPPTSTLPAEVVDHSGVDIALDPGAEPPGAKFEALMEDSRFAKTWERGRDDLQDQSASSYDMSLASQAVRAEWTAQETANLMIAHRRKHGDDLKLRLDYYQRTIATAREGLENGKDAVDALIEELNLRHAVIHVDRTAILTEKHDPVFGRKNIVLESKQSFNDWYAPREHEGKKVSTIWFSHPKRRQYDSLVFSPGGDVTGHYNMFQGFPIKPVEGDCSRYLDLIMDVICNGNQEHYDYLIKWFAHLFQKPAELPGTALVMRGLQGTGKGTMMKYPGQLVGQHYLEVVQMRQVVGHFNAHLKDALLVHANEAVWGGDKASEGAIKAMITDETSAVEFKGRDIQTVKNYKRLVLASNHDWVAPRDMDDRRFFVLDVSDVHKEDQDYFAAIHEEMSAGGLEALMHHLVHVDLTDFNPRMMPETDGAGFDMKLRGMDSVMQWLHEVLNDGVLPADHNNQLAIDHCWPDEYPTASLHSLYVNWCRTQNQRHPDPKEIFGGKLRGLLIRKKARKSIRGSRPWYYKLHSLEDCRSKFEAACKEGAYIWSDEDAED